MSEAEQNAETIPSSELLNEQRTRRSPRPRSRSNALGNALNNNTPRHSSPLRQVVEEAPSRSDSEDRVPQAVNRNTTTATPTPTPGRRRKHKHFHKRLNWNLDWKTKDWGKGRVLIIDYISNEYLRDGRPQIVTQEINDIGTLERCYSNKERSKRAALRLIHVQNARWATKFFLEKFNISVQDDMLGMSFGNWAKFEKPDTRGGRPSVKGKTWRVQKDPWRKVQRAAFGMDYLKQYPVEKIFNADQFKMMELNAYDENDVPCYGYDVFIQRLSVYMQFEDSNIAAPDDLPNPYDERVRKQKMEFDEQYTDGKANFYRPHKFESTPHLDSLDNGNAIVIFETSQSESLLDTLMAARGEIEAGWRRLTFFLPREDIATDRNLVFQCSNSILQDVFKGLAYNWDMFLTISDTHVGILEDKIYESPADETRAPELWKNSKIWLRVEKLLVIHSNIVQELVERFRVMSEDYDDLNVNGRGLRWLEGLPEEFTKLGNMVQESLVKPTANLNDLMYKSVGIRDSRHSLTLNDSLWRLSWITFIFLPLTFAVGFFGMNVDTFKNDPSIKWYFISVVPLMIIVLGSVIVFKRAINKWWQTPYQRGVYEHLFHDLAIEHPDLWSRRGPRKYVEPEGFANRLKWRLLNHWFDPSKTIAVQPDADEEMGGSGLSLWARTKRRLARRWLSTIKSKQSDTNSFADLDENGDMSATTEMLGLATNVAAAEGDPAGAAITLQNIEQLNLPVANGHIGGYYSQTRRPLSADAKSASHHRDSSVGSSAMIFEEEEVDDEDYGTPGRDNDQSGNSNRENRGTSKPRSSLDGMKRSIEGAIRVFEGSLSSAPAPATTASAAVAATNATTAINDVVSLGKHEQQERTAQARQASGTASASPPQSPPSVPVNDNTTSRSTADASNLEETATKKNWNELG